MDEGIIIFYSIHRRLSPTCLSPLIFVDNIASILLALLGTIFSQLITHNKVLSRIPGLTNHLIPTILRRGGDLTHLVLAHICWQVGVEIVLSS